MISGAVSLLRQSEPTMVFINRSTPRVRWNPLQGRPLLRETGRTVQVNRVGSADTVV